MHHLNVLYLPIEPDLTFTTSSLLLSTERYQCTPNSLKLINTELRVIIR